MFQLACIRDVCLTISYGKGSSQPIVGFQIVRIKDHV